ncbi:MAG: DUF2948 family protein [Dongiaceae bacterium]
MVDKFTLVAKDNEDLQVIAACLQDGLVRIGDLQFFAEEGRFAILVNRFKWEDEVDEIREVSAGKDRRFASTQMHQRVHSGVAFDRVRSIKMRGIDRQDRDRILNLLTITAEENGIVLIFSGAATIRLDTEGIACRVVDLDEPWPTAWRPKHEGAGGA